MFRDELIIGGASGFIEIEIDDDFVVEATYDNIQLIEENKTTISQNKGITLTN